MKLCNWCGENLRGPARAIYWGLDGYDYCSEYCRETKRKADEEDEKQNPKKEEKQR